MNAAAVLKATPLAVSFRTSVLPWSVAADDERRFKRILKRVLAIALLLALILPWIPRPEVERKEAQALPPPIAKLLLERPNQPPPPPKPGEVAKVDPKATELPPKATVPKEKQPPVPEARNPVANKPPGEDAARKKASGVGLLAMKNEIAEMTGAPLAVQLKEVKPGPGVGTGVGVGVGAGTEAGIPVRAMITAAAGHGSGGINTAAYSRDTGGGGLAGRATTLVEGVAGGGGGGGPGGGGGSARGGGNGTGGIPAHAGGAVQKGGSGKASRSLEEIRLVFDRNKGSIYAIYNRALREEPSLQGKVVLSLTIAPSGAVTDCRIVSSELKTPELENKLLARIRQFDFGAKDVAEMVVTYPVDFLPS